MKSTSGAERREFFCDSTYLPSTRQAPDEAQDQNHGFRCSEVPDKAGGERGSEGWAGTGQGRGWRGEGEGLGLGLMEGTGLEGRSWVGDGLVMGVGVERCGIQFGMREAVFSSCDGWCF